MCFLLPWGCTSHDELVYHPAHPISRFKLPTVSECKAGLQGSGVLFFFFLASGGTLLISSDYVPPKTLDLHDCHFIKTSRHHVKTILFRRIRHSESHFPRLLQRNLHARQLLWMLFLAALQHTKPSKTSKAGVTVWTRSQKDSSTEAAWKHCDSEAPMLPMLLVGVWS